MPPVSKNAPRKRTRARNKRTTAAEESTSDIASSSSSSAESSEEAEPTASSTSARDQQSSRDDEPVTQPKKKRKRSTKNVNDAAIEASAGAMEPEEANEKTSAPARTPQGQLDADFEAFYMRQVPPEFAKDLEKLRSAPDFKDSSVPVLIRALKQGTSLFDEKEKRMVLGLDRAQ